MVDLTAIEFTAEVEELTRESLLVYVIATASDYPSTFVRALRISYWVPNTELELLRDIPLSDIIDSSIEE